MRSVFLSGAAALASALIAGGPVDAAIARVTDRVQVGGTGNNTTQAFASSLRVVLTSPEEYPARGCCLDADSGGWVGPVWVGEDTPDIRGTSDISWSVGFEETRSPAEAVARAVLIHGYQTQIESGAVRVTHEIDGKKVGSVPGHSLIMKSEAQAVIDAQHEASLAFSLGSGVYAFADFGLLAPYADGTGYGGHNMVQSMSGPVLASTWNRLQAYAAIDNIKLDGNLPPSKVSAASTANSQRVRGRVKDAFGDPLVDVRVRLQRRTGSGWRTVRSGRTSTSGRYSLAAGAEGSYSAYVRLGGTSKRSRTVAAGG